MTVEHIDYEKCTACLWCYKICPMDVYRTAGKEVYIAYPDDCMCCYLCELPSWASQAVSLVKKEWILF
jgi:NAD-dependent dihydropyrimidine dehydrogenase PreA subunit